MTGIQSAHFSKNGNYERHGNKAFSWGNGISLASCPCKVWQVTFRLTPRNKAVQSVVKPRPISLLLVKWCSSYVGHWVPWGKHCPSTLSTHASLSVEVQGLECLLDLNLSSESLVLDLLKHTVSFHPLCESKPKWRNFLIRQCDNVLKENWDAMSTLCSLIKLRQRNQWIS